MVLAEPSAFYYKHLEGTQRTPEKAPQDLWEVTLHFSLYLEVSSF